MTADQSGDNRPSFEELLNGQLNPLLQKDAVQRKIIRDVEWVASEATESQQIKAFEDRRDQISDLLGRFNVERRLGYIRKNIWKRGVIEPIFEDTTLDSDKHPLARGKVLVGYGMYYHTPAVIEFEGVHGLEAPKFTYDKRKYFPVSETQYLRIVASGRLEDVTLMVDSSSSLDVPNRIVDCYDISGNQLQRFPFISYTYDHNSTVHKRTHYDVLGRSYEIYNCDFSFARIDSDSDLYKVRINHTLSKEMTTSEREYMWKATLEKLARLLQNTQTPNIISSEEETGQYVEHREFKADAAGVFDEILLEDCKDRTLRGKLPLQTREYWSKYILGPDSYDDFFGGNRVYRVFDEVWIKKELDTGDRSLSPAFSDHPTSSLYYIDTTEVPYYGKDYVHPRNHWEEGHMEWRNLVAKVSLVYADFNKVRDLVTREMSADEIIKFKAVFENENGFSFDDVTEWMREAPRLAHRGNGIFMNEEELAVTNSLVDDFNKANSDLEYKINDQEVSLARDQAAIKLFMLAYHYKLDRIKSGCANESWGRFVLESGSKIWG